MPHDAIGRAVAVFTQDVACAVETLPLYASMIEAVAPAAIVCPRKTMAARRCVREIARGMIFLEAKDRLKP